jgi:hypothetical protein
MISISYGLYRKLYDIARRRVRDIVSMPLPNPAEPEPNRLGVTAPSLSRLGGIRKNWRVPPNTLEGLY